MGSHRDFEDWLLREKPKQQSQLAGLRSHTTGPTFINISIENSLDLDFYKSNDMISQQHWRHWCLLGEIVGFAMLARLQMEIKDADSAEFPLFFYTDGRGDELSPVQVQKGHTIAILYAKKHKFLYSEPGIRHVDPQLFKVFDNRHYIYP
jgi:hypothetical protein